MTKIHPDLRRAARLSPKGGIGPRLLPVLRWMTDRMSRRSRSGIETIELGEQVVRLHRPPGVTGPLPALLWIHGGGYVIGTPAQDDPLCREMCRELGVVVAAVSYRLAPQHPFPAGLDDCFAGLTWLRQQPFVDASRIAVGGASAGGGLAAAVALRARAEGVPLQLQLLVYPMLDDRTCLRTDVDESDFRLWNLRGNNFGWRSYTGMEPGAADVPPLAAVARCEDLSGVAPAWVGVGTCDLFHDEDLAYAERLRAAGVPCEVEVVDGAFHGFDSVAPKAPVVRRFTKAKIAALAAALG
ncbi:MAG TPA: alpha/beta hydrolase [Mycobacteriales bacterium]|nr:alpha/beta hydrolase [Mycobacteriales bacterium]